ncbi:MAG TPA: flagellar basal body-associated FliL family protein [Alphaproteobacteria bacterium]|nr:flagellar basal body-associated FliL family protein [Alphaproteobacteria bacterium]
MVSDTEDAALENADGLSADAAAQGLGAAEEAGGFKAKKIILIVLPILILLGGGAGAYFMGYLDGVLPGREIDCQTVQEGDGAYEACLKKLAKADSTPGVFVDVPDMVVNLNTSGRQRSYLKIVLKVELEKAADQAKFEMVMPRVVDQFQTYLRELRPDDLRGSSGLYRMKIELLNRVRAATPDIAVRDVLFQEMMMQ